jgi:ABC-type uncharacterized transport system involved in gliding motility auxiliary subunit
MKKGLETYLYTTVGVVAFLAIIIGVNLIGSRAKVRVDLTSERAYTLSQGTRAILSKLDTPVQVRFYCTRGENSMPVMLKNYAQSVEDLLGEFRQASKGQIEIQKLDPVPDSDAEDSAKLDGVDGQMVELGSDPIFLGLSITMLDQKEVIPFLDPSRQKMLEYDLARAITRVTTPTRPVIGVMSPLPFNGSAAPMMMMQRNRQQQQQPWVLATQLKKDFTLTTVEMTADKIPDEVKVLLVIHPKAISESAQYAIDQFLMRGGKLIACLDPLAALDPAAGGGPMGGGSSSNLDKLLKAWGLTFDSTKIVADMDNIFVQPGQTRGDHPALIELSDAYLNGTDILTSNLGKFFLPFAGAITGTPAEGLQMTTLARSSKKSQLIESMSAQMGGEQIVKDFKASGTEYNLAVRVSGKFKTAFPDGKPKAPEAKPEEGKPEEKKPETASVPGLKESPADTTVILIGDSDFLQDRAAFAQSRDPFGRTVLQAINGNMAMSQAAVEQLAGDSNLIAVRSRASRERPFTVVKKMQADAEAAFQTKIKELETSLRDAQAKLNELQQNKAGEGKQKFILSTEQQAEIANFRAKESAVNKQLKQERKNLRIGVEALETKTKWLNILGMPLVVAAAGVFFALRRRSVQAAR